MNSPANPPSQIQKIKMLVATAIAATTLFGGPLYAQAQVAQRQLETIANRWGKLIERLELKVD